MSGENWSDDELRAAVQAYMHMLLLNERGVSFKKSDFSRALLAGPLKSRTSVDHRMQNISHVLHASGRRWLPGYVPQANVGRATAQRIGALIEEAEREYPTPLMPSVAAPTTRKHPPTGYWVLMCNRSKWDADAWLRCGEQELLYTVSEHHRDEMQIGDLAVLRVARTARTRTQPERPLAVYAIMEVEEAPTWRLDDAAFWAAPEQATEPRWRARFRVLANLVDEPVALATLPDLPGLSILKGGQQTSSVAIERALFDAVLDAAGDRTQNLALVRRAGSTEGARALEQEAQGRTPKVKERFSRMIERGPEGERVKRRLQYRCQLCEVLGQVPLSFEKRGGGGYAEAHHVMPVASLAEGALGEHNIMVMCAHHHRQAHYGAFDIVSTTKVGWRVRVDGRCFDLARG